MGAPLQLSKADARRALIRHHFTPATSIAEVFHRLRSIQFDPIAPVGCNHDLVLQSRLKDYKIGDWERAAYQDRLIYDGWDKQASLVPYEGWAIRRLFHQVHRAHFSKIFDEHGYAVDAILKEINDRGALHPRQFEFQERKEEWKGSWHGPNVVKQTLRALWHTGQVMTTGRQGGHHIYDLPERVIPPQFQQASPFEEQHAKRELFLDRHRAMGVLAPNAGPEVWSYGALRDDRKLFLPRLVQEGEIVPVEIEGVKAHVTPEFLKLLDFPSLEPSVKFIAPLDQLLWDRKMVAHLFNFDYCWEIYTPEVKRRWGYYVLPVLFGDDLVARIEFWSRDGVLEVRQWHWEEQRPGQEFHQAFQQALLELANYCSAKELRTLPHVKADFFEKISW